MIVYCTSFSLKSTSTFESVLNTIAPWIARKAKENFNPACLQATSIWHVGDGVRVEVATTDANFPRYYAVRCQEPDRYVSGRRWITEVGLHQEDASHEVDCTVLLETSEISSRVDAPVQASRPLLVRNILVDCAPSASTPGLAVKALDSRANIEAFPYEIELSSRTYPIVLVSPTAEGKYLVDLNDLLFYLGGLADIIQIPVEADTWLISDVVGNQYAAWRGAINLIFPEVRGLNRQYIPTKRLLPEELGEMLADGTSPAKEILSILTHRMNLPHSRRHITIERVQEAKRRQELMRLRDEAASSGEVGQYVLLLEQDNQEKNSKLVELEQRVERLENENSDLETKWYELDDEKNSREYEIEGLKQALIQVNSMARSANNCLSEEDRDALEQALLQNTTPEQSLRVMVLLFGERIEVLPTAWEAAAKSAAFKERSKLQGLLWKFCTDYWQAMADGKGDAEAHAIFGNAYAPNEGAAGDKPRARSRRTFLYDDENHVMLKHLKIGRKDSTAETIRVHFEWFAQQRKLVIGYCGTPPGQHMTWLYSLLRS